VSVETVSLSAPGPQVSRLVQGFWRLARWQLTAAALVELIEDCLELGITTMDHAAVYGGYSAEALFGEALGLRPDLRARMQIVSKCGIRMVHKRRPEHGVTHYDTSRGHIVASVEDSLRNLRTDHLDLLLIHRPDPLLDADEVAAAFDELKRAGKVLHPGVSNFTPPQFELLHARVPDLATNQIEISVTELGGFGDGSLDQLQRLRLRPMAWSPMGGGTLFGDGERARRVRRALETVGQELGGAGVDQVALAWLLAHPSGIVPVLGTGKRERIRSAAGAVELKLTREQWFSIWIASTGTGVP
jgi:predicted oxidoreductase